MAKYLVTGGAGFIGSNLVDQLVLADNEIVVVDDLSMGLVANLPQSDHVRFIEHSITDHPFMQELLKTERFDYIVLLAAIASVADSVERPYATHLVNQEANLNIIETIRQAHLPLKKLFFASSAAVYGDDPALPKKEDMAVKPLTQYAVDKYATERAIINYARLYDLPFVTVRFFNVFGPKQNPASPYSGVLSILLNALAHDLPFTFFGDGGQTRDFTYVSDVVSAIVGLLHTPEAKGDVYNIANGQQTSLQAVADTLQAITHKTLNVTYQAARAGDIRDSYANVDKINALGFMTHTPLKAGLQAYVQSVL
ncbi:NAD-dependent epimerase/dehydratase family protein [Lacticaseibacillus baoqingensis]|uniref:NAD-dependent epimerase/dehydratase family protein n=1 Tax=Lacticaseibacillus baoqingensis TaxID=2486013 RepID=A0ABW4E1A3_9LACO|nr:NAD-dependent epimerase/dehydratase family protein [Lacticaseibacillus baoqingensis]